MKIILKFTLETAIAALVSLSAFASGNMSGQLTSLNLVSSPMNNSSVQLMQGDSIYATTFFSTAPNEREMKDFVGELSGSAYSIEVRRNSPNDLIRSMELRWESGLHVVCLFEFNPDNTFSEMKMTVEDKGVFLFPPKENFCTWFVSEINSKLPRKKLNSLPLYGNYLSKNDFMIEQLYINDHNSAAMLKLGGFLVYRFITIAQDIDIQCANEEVIRNYRERGTILLAGDLLPCLQKVVRGLLQEVASYNKLDSIEEQYNRSILLSARITEIDAEMRPVISTDSLYREHRDYLQSTLGQSHAFRKVWDHQMAALFDSLALQCDSGKSPAQFKAEGLALLRTTDSLIRQTKELLYIDSLAKREHNLLARNAPSVYSKAREQARRASERYQEAYFTVTTMEEKILCGRQWIKALADEKAVTDS